MPASTIRAWVLGLAGAVVIPGINQLFYFRYPSIMVGQFVAQLVLFPFGRAWARLFPAVMIFGKPLNPGPFSIKEHVLATIMASVGAPSAYATEIIAVQRVMYKQVFGFGYQYMLVLSTQLIGFSMGGVARCLLVMPASMIWPNTLVQGALFNTLHSQVYAGIGGYEGMSRERFFSYAFVAFVVWYFIPGYLFQALSVFSWVCWIAPNNVKLNQLFGYRSGLGFSLLTFDWNQIAFIGSPLATPWWAEVNVMIGFFFAFWFITPILYYSNVWYSTYLPISANTAYDNRGHVYNLTRVIDPQTKSLDLAQYKAYSPLFLPMSFLMSYACSFLGIGATISHAAIHFRKPIKKHLFKRKREVPDVHARLISQYPKVPEWHYFGIFVVSFVMACVCIRVWPTGMTIQALLVALALPIIFMIPIGMIQASTNQQVPLNVIAEMIVGFMLPGKPIAMMIFKTYGYITLFQAMQFTGDNKLGHYMKVPPRAMFWAQIAATVVAVTSQLAVQIWMFGHIPNFCNATQADDFTCANVEVFGTASVVWGVIGPGLQFAKGQIYYALCFLFIAGAMAPVVLWLYTRKHQNTLLKYLHFPLIFAGIRMIPPATAANFVPWAFVGFFFQFVMRRRFFPYWAKYNYALSAAADAGTAVGIILVYFCLQYPRDGSIGNDSIQQFWGNRVFKQTSDWNQVPLRVIQDTDPPFGPQTW